MRPSSEGTVEQSSSPWTWMCVVSPMRRNAVLKRSIRYTVARRV
jgi:hypothetical protein